MNKTLLSVLIVFMCIVVPFGGFCQLQVNSVQSATSTCANNGIITVNASTNAPPLIYSIISGPVTAPVQTNNVFNSIPAGNYMIRVADGAGNSLTSPVTVDGNYLQPDFSPIKVSPYCAGGNDGQITGNITAGTGLAPFTWQLIAPSPVITAPQSSNVFTGLSAGNYTVRVTDACGGFRTLVVSLNDPPSSMLTFLPGIGRINKFGCDSAIVTTYLHADIVRTPITFTFQTNTGTFSTTTPTGLSFTTPNDFALDQVLPNFNYGDYVIITATDDCGNTATAPQYFCRPYFFCQTFNNYYENCNYTSSALYDLNNIGCYSFNQLLSGAAGPLTCQVTDPGGAVVYADVANGFADNNGYQFVSGISVPPLPVNVNYHIRITDRCGELFESDFFVSTPAIIPPVIYKDIYRDGCTDSSAYVFIRADNYKSEPKIVFISGPAGIGSTKPGYEYNATYIYPDTMNISGIGSNTYRFDIGHLTVGTYYFKVYDTCGVEMFDSLVIAPNQVTDFGHHFWYKKGCLGLNEIHYTVNAVNGVMDIRNLSNNMVTSTYYSSQDFDAGINDSLVNLPSGSYELVYTYSGYFGGGTPLESTPYNCQVIRDTVIIEGYQTPAIFASNYIQCQSGIHVEILPDSSKGVPPYQYEIISGPQVFPVQTSNLFNLAAPGVYTVRIYDICGNGSTSQVTVDPIIFPPVDVLPFSCNSTSLSYQHSEYYNYSWIAPDGTMFTGDTLTIDPVTPADTGTYNVIKVVNINGCVDTFYTTYHLALNNVNEQTMQLCSGNSITIGIHTYNTTGTYTDTLVNSSLCDSIIVLHLTVTAFLRDTISQTICAGQSISFNGQLYTQPGFYNDTLSTATCDSIATLHLLVLPEIRDTITTSVCNGQSYTVDGHEYTQTGVYSDTLNVTGCDSIVVLNLTVLPVIRNTIIASVCTGQTYSMGGNPYSQTGIYTDTLNTSGCDSIIVLTLTVVPLLRDTIARAVCAGQSYSFGGNTYATTGNYSDTLNISGCDSISVLSLTVLPVIRDTILRSVCSGQGYNFGGNIYILTGVYSDTLSTAGCDSISVLNLTVLPVIRDTVIRSVCARQSYTFGGNVYTLSGIYSDTLSTSGCDSISVLNLTVLPELRDTILRSACAGQGYTFGGNTYIQSGSYSDTLSTGGCDSIIVLSLTITPQVRDTVTASVCPGQGFIFNGNEYTQAGFYSDTLQAGACDSIVTLQLSVLPAPQVNLSASAHTVSSGDMIQLNVTQSASYLWTSTGATLSNPLMQDPTAIIQNSTWIYVNTLSDPDGCPAEDSVFISVSTDTMPCAGSYILMPGAFTPNDDGLNDKAGILYDKVSLVRFVIYNRWGEKVFETVDINKGWDGKYKGNMLAGNYVYMISYYVPCNPNLKLLRGSILLIR